MAKLEGAESLKVKLLQQLGKKLESPNARRGNVVVGYAARYAYAVHELTDMVLEGEPRPSGKGVYWGPRGQAKFLEQPAREHRDHMARLIVGAVRAGVKLEQALFLAGKFLQGESQRLVPREYSNLAGSAFTQKEKGR